MWLRRQQEVRKRHLEAVVRWVLSRDTSVFARRAWFAVAHGLATTSFPTLVTDDISRAGFDFGIFLAEMKINSCMLWQIFPLHSPMSDHNSLVHASTLDVTVEKLVIVSFLKNFGTGGNDTRSYNVVLLTSQHCTVKLLYLELSVLNSCVPHMELCS